MMTVWLSSIWKSTTWPAEPKGISSSRKRALLPVAFRQLNGNSSNVAMPYTIVAIAMHSDLLGAQNHYRKPIHRPEIRALTQIAADRAADNLTPVVAEPLERPARHPRPR